MVTAPDDASARAEILLLSSSILVPCLRHEGATVWDTLAIAEYLNEVMPDAGLLPADRVQRAHCRSICGEIHSGFTTLRASLPVNLKGHFPGFKIWSRAQADIDRVCTIWRECLAQVRRAVPVRRAHHGGRDVCAGRDTLHDLRREARAGLMGYARPSWPCPRCRNGSRPPRPSRPISRSSRSNIRQRARRLARLKGSNRGQVCLSPCHQGREPARRPAGCGAHFQCREPGFRLRSPHFDAPPGRNRRSAARLA